MTDDNLDTGVEDGDVLLAFADAIVQQDHDLPAARAAVVETLGSAVMVDAAGVASNFERMVRIADATGIELGDFLAEVSADARQTLGLERPAGR